MKTRYSSRFLVTNVDLPKQKQDSYGDTALHDAIGKENSDIIEALAASPTIDFTLKNKRGFNVLHHAALKGNYLYADCEN